MNTATMTTTTMGTGRAITLLLLVGLAEASVAQLPDRLGFVLKGFSFAEHGLSAPKDLLVDDHGYAWVLGEQGTYCLVGGCPVQVHDLAAHADVIAWAPPRNRMPVIRQIFPRRRSCGWR